MNAYFSTHSSLKLGFLSGHFFGFLISNSHIQAKNTTDTGCHTTLIQSFQHYAKQHAQFSLFFKCNLRLSEWLEQR